MKKDHKDVMRFCREKIARATVQIEFNLTVAVKDDTKHFYKYITARKGRLNKTSC